MIRLVSVSTVFAAWVLGGGRLARWWMRQVEVDPDLENLVFTSVLTGLYVAVMVTLWRVCWWPIITDVNWARLFSRVTRWRRARLSTRQHEAAHAVVGLALGFTVTEVVTSGHASGHVRLAPPDAWSGQRHYDDLVVWVAGAAQNSLTGELGLGSLHDIGRAHDLATLISLGTGSDTTPHELVRQAFDDAVALCQSHAPQVEAVAENLRTRPWLSAKQLEAVIRNAGLPAPRGDATPAPWKVRRASTPTNQAIDSKIGHMVASGRPNHGTTTDGETPAPG